MDYLFSLIMGWKELIVKVFEEYPLAGAVITAIAFSAIYILDKDILKGQRKKNISIVFVAWLIAVPVVGFLITLLTKIWEIVEGTVPRISGVFTSFYKIYDHHPLMVLFLTALGLAAYFFWKTYLPNLLPKRWWRIVFLVAAVVLITHLVAPIANLFSPPHEERATDPKSIPD